MPTSHLTPGRHVTVNDWHGTVLSLRRSWVDVLIMGMIFRVNVAEVWSVEAVAL